MLRPGALDRLNDHQNGIVALLDEKEPLVVADARHDVATLARARWALMRALTAYAMFKHREIFDPLIAKARPADAHKLLRMKRACLELGDEFRAYVQKWSAADVQTHWTEYRPAACAMIARIRAHLARERADVAALQPRRAARPHRLPPPAIPPPRPGRPIPAG